MVWEAFQKNPRSPKDDLVATVHLYKTGFTFSRRAEAEWVRGKKFAEILVDYERKRIAFRLTDERTRNCYMISKTGTRSPCLKITCMAVFRFLGLEKPARSEGILQGDTVELTEEFPQMQGAQPTKEK